MPDAGRQVLVTRPEPGLSETVDAVRRMGFEPVLSPLLRVRARSTNLPVAEHVQAILLTSGQAVPVLAGQAPGLAGCRLLAVGDGTARRAVQAGFARVESAASDAAGLVALAARILDPAGRPLLLACGTGQSRAVTADLRSLGFRVRRRCVYAARPVVALPAEALAALSGRTVDAALFFSGETAAAFVRLLPADLRPNLEQVRALAVSVRAAEPLRALPWRSIEAAATPDAAAMLSLLGRA